MAPTHRITFLTDYGLSDGFVAACHGVIDRISPQTRVTDITHLIPPGDVRRGAAILAQTVPYMAASVHVGVVDPGVGTSRRAIALAAGEHVFVGPDNGLLTWAAHGPGLRAYELTARDLWGTPSATFHGRDIFAPVAAHLSAGRDLGDVGPEISPSSLVTLPVPVREVRDGVAEGEVLTVDRFGNVQLSLVGEDLVSIDARTGGTLAVTLGRRLVTMPYGSTFGSVPPGELMIFVDSSDHVAIAVNSGDAAQRLGLPPGARVSVTTASQRSS